MFYKQICTLILGRNYRENLGRIQFLYFIVQKGLKTAGSLEYGFSWVSLISYVVTNNSNVSWLCRNISYVLIIHNLITIMLKPLVYRLGAWAAAKRRVPMSTKARILSWSDTMWSLLSLYRRRWIDRKTMPRRITIWWHKTKSWEMRHIHKCRLRPKNSSTWVLNDN